MASSTTETGGAPRQTAPASGEGLRLGRTDRACVHPRARGFYALPAWGILVIRTGEKTVIPPTRLRRGVGAAWLRAPDRSPAGRGARGDGQPAGGILCR